MCTANAALGAQAFGGAAQTVGSYYAASAQRAQLRAQADIADIQARGEQSPDDSDAFMLTFAQAVAIPRAAATPPPRPTRSTWG